MNEGGETCHCILQVQTQRLKSGGHSQPTCHPPYVNTIVSLAETLMKGPRKRVGQRQRISGRQILISPGFKAPRLIPILPKAMWLRMPHLRPSQKALVKLRQKFQHMSNCVILTGAFLERLGGSALHRVFLPLWCMESTPNPLLKATIKFSLLLSTLATQCNLVQSIHILCHAFSYPLTQGHVSGCRPTFWPLVQSFFHCFVTYN